MLITIILIILLIACVVLAAWQLTAIDGPEGAHRTRTKAIMCCGIGLIILVIALPLTQNFAGTDKTIQRQNEEYTHIQQVVADLPNCESDAIRANIIAQAEAWNTATISQQEYANSIWIGWFFDQKAAMARKLIEIPSLQ